VAGGLGVLAALVYLGRALLRDDAAQ